MNVNELMEQKAVTKYAKDFKRELVIESLEWCRQKGAGISAANQGLLRLYPEISAGGTWNTTTNHKQVPPKGWL